MTISRPNLILIMNPKLLLIFLIVNVVDCSVFGQDGSYARTNAKVSPFPDRSVVLTPSWIKQREALNTAYLLSLDPNRLLHNFRINAGLPSAAKPLAGWEAPDVGIRGHFTGHYMPRPIRILSTIQRWHCKVLKPGLSFIICHWAHRRPKGF